LEKKDFPEDVKIKCLLWSDRHCCLCGKQRGTGIEIAHIDACGPSTIDNAIPLCLNCHEKVGHYNVEHPKGNKYRPKELISRREQLYDRYTSYLVPQIDFQVVQVSPFPDVGFLFTHVGGAFPARFRVKCEVFLGNKKIGTLKDHYSGQKEWNLNPGHRFYGHTAIPVGGELKDRLEIDTTITIIDVYGREHQWLPVGHIYDPKNNSWFAEPCPLVDKAKQITG
jgi:hypothetical protein